MNGPDFAARASLAAVIDHDLVKMFLDIPGVRAAVLPAELRLPLSELRSFRHVFRHSYDFRLDPQRLTALVRTWRAQGPDVARALGAFAAWLRRELSAEV